MKPTDGDHVHPESVEKWRSWLEEHHASSRGVWLVSWKPHTWRPVLPYEDAVLEALAVGWIDSHVETRKSVRRR